MQFLTAYFSVKLVKQNIVQILINRIIMRYEEVGDQMKFDVIEK